MNRAMLSQTELGTYDEVLIELPECPDAARMIVRPLKTIFINVAADSNANIDMLFADVDDFTDFLPEGIMLLM